MSLSLLPPFEKIQQALLIVQHPPTLLFLSTSSSQLSPLFLLDTHSYFPPGVLCSHGPAQQHKDFWNIRPLEGLLALQDRDNKEKFSSTPTLKKQFQGSTSQSQREGNYPSPRYTHCPPLQRKQNLSESKHFSPLLLGTLDIWIPYLEPSACLLKS